MATIQHQDARKLLKILVTAYAGKRLLTYAEAAELIGRVPGKQHARAVAQVCDLLDAAACLAGVPAFALVQVRDTSGNFNPDAWKSEKGPRRDAIIARSTQHKFLPNEFKAIARALDDLRDRGNRASWSYLQELYPGDLLFRRLMGGYSDHENAIDDLGSDSPDKEQAKYWSYKRDPKVREAVVKRARGICEYCGTPGFLKSDGSRYIETHHVIALANDGADRLTNVIALCPNDHREAHFGERAEDMEQEMLKKLQILNQSDAAST